MLVYIIYTLSNQNEFNTILPVKNRFLTVTRQRGPDITAIGFVTDTYIIAAICGHRIISLRGLCCIAGVHSLSHVVSAARCNWSFLIRDKR